MIDLKSKVVKNGLKQPKNGSDSRVCSFDYITITLTTGLFNFSSLSLQCHYIFTLFHTTEKEKGGGHDA